MGQAVAVHARLQPDRVGVRDLERRMTFREWNARSCRLANALLGLSLVKGDRIAILAYNCVEWLEIYAATGKAGLVAVPVNFRLTGPEARYRHRRRGVGSRHRPGLSLANHRGGPGRPSHSCRALHRLRSGDRALRLPRL